MCRLFALLIALQLSTGVTGRADELQRFEASRKQLGTDVQIILYAATREQAEAAFLAGFERIDQLEAVLSDYDPDSEASRLGQLSPMKRPVAVSADLWRALRVSSFVSQRTGGAFDVTVGPLSRLWRRARRQRELPAEERLSEALKAVGYRHLRFDQRHQSVRLSRPGMKLDFGGIGKGMAADVALAEIVKKGVRSALVDCGGDMSMADAPPGSAGWRIGVAGLDSEKAESVIELSHVGVATSGDAYQYVEIGGVRYSHIVNPHTGIGLTTRSSVTVVATDGTLADALASAVSVLGPRRGIKLARHWHGVEAQVVSLQGGNPVLLVTPGFPEAAAMKQTKQ